MNHPTVIKDGCRIEIEGKSYSFPVQVGAEGERGIDVSDILHRTGCITYDKGYANTGSCLSSITYIDGDLGILRYRGIPIEQLAEHSTFVETAYLIIYGELPNQTQLQHFSELFTKYEMLHEGLKHHFEGFPPTAHPMAILSAMINAMGCYEPDITQPNITKTDITKTDGQFDELVARLLSKVRTIAAFSYKKSIGQPFIYPHPSFSYCANLLHMMFSVPYQEYNCEPEVVAALNKFFILHADHEQNCSTSTVRLVASSQANLYASVASGVCSLWGPLHGGANMAVIDMLNQISREKISVRDYVAKVKDSSTRIKLMGFGHRVYKNYDPRAKIIKDSCEKVFRILGTSEPLLDLAMELEQVALADDYFVSRRLYPNVDFYSGLLMKALGIPTDMFTVMFAIGRMPGWIANWLEETRDPKGRIGRPRQIYTGHNLRNYVGVKERG